MDGERLARAVDGIESRFRPAAVVLFGSRAKGRVRPRDFDLGVVRPAADVDAFELAALRTDLEDLLGAPVDLVVLDRASPILRMEVLRAHRVLAMRDADAFEDFAARAVLEYIDLKRVRAPIERALVAGAPK